MATPSPTDRSVWLVTVPSVRSVIRVSGLLDPGRPIFLDAAAAGVHLERQIVDIDDLIELAAFACNRVVAARAGQRAAAPADHLGAARVVLQGDVGANHRHVFGLERTHGAVAQRSRRAVLRRRDHHCWRRHRRSRLRCFPGC